MKNMKRILSGICLASMLMLLYLPFKVSAATGVGVQYRTEEEIKNRIVSSGAAYLQNEYSVEPDETAGKMNPGDLTAQTRENALKGLNNIRYIAGIYDKVTLNDTYNQEAQAGAFLNSVLNELNHHPTQPEGMSDELYDLGYSGTSSSNLCAGLTLYGSQFLYMSDSDSSNIDRLGHRRWLLDPSMVEVGFGSAGYYSATYVMGRGNSENDCNGIVWPAQNMPIDYFNDDDAWSYTTDTITDPSAVRVTLRQEGTGKTWTFSGDQTYSPNDDKYFNVDTAGYGRKECIVFRPDQVKYRQGDIFHVDITGGGVEASYDVHFFGLVPVEGIQIDGSDEVVLGEEFSLGLFFFPEDASRTHITWESSDPSVVEISDDSEVTYIEAIARSVGTATITATTENGKKSSFVVKVLKDYYGDDEYDYDDDYDYEYDEEWWSDEAVKSRPVKITSISLSGISKKIARGKSMKLTATVLPGKASNKKLKWTSNNKNIATVTKAGLVKINKKAKPGKKVTITARATDGSGKTASWKITVMKGAVKSIKVKGYKKTLKAGKTMKLKASVKVSKGKPVNKKLKWSSSKPKYAKVDQTGKVKALPAGKGKTVIITVMSTDGTNKKVVKKIKIK